MVPASLALALGPTPGATLSGCGRGFHDQVGCVGKIGEEHLGINCIQKGTLPQKNPAGPKAVCKLQGNGTLVEKSYQAE